MKLQRQGDLGFVQITPELFQQILKKFNGQKIKDKKIILAHGEKTGHKHTLTAEKQALMTAYRLDNGMVLFVYQNKGGEVKHNIHKKVKFTVAPYIQDTQREYDELEAFKKTID